MLEIHKLQLSDLYVLRNSLQNGPRVKLSATFAPEGLKLRNHKNGKDYLFRYNKVFKDVNTFGSGENCFIHYTKTDSTYANKARFTKQEFKKISKKYRVGRYPFDANQLSFLNNFMLEGNYLHTFIFNYIVRFIEYKEKDAKQSEVENKGESMNDDLSFLDGLGCSDRNYQDPKGAAKSKNKTKEGNEMNKITQVATDVVDVNKEAIKLAAKLEVGKVATAQLKKVVKPKLPMMVRGYADSPLFDIVLANAVGVALREYAGNNPKAQIVSEAMIQSAAVEMVSSFNVNEMIEEMLENIDVSSITGSKED